MKLVTSLIISLDSKGYQYQMKCGLNKHYKLDSRTVITLIFGPFVELFCLQMGISCFVLWTSLACMKHRQHSKRLQNQKRHKATKQVEDKCR